MIDKYFDKAATPLSGLLVGYGAAHVLLQFFAVQLLFSTFKISAGNSWKTNINPSELMCIMVAGALIRMLFRGDEQQFRLFTVAGMAVWVVVAVLM